MRLCKSFDGFRVKIPFGADLSSSIGLTEPDNVVPTKMNELNTKIAKDTKSERRHFQARQLDSFFALFVLLNSGVKPWCGPF